MITRDELIFYSASKFKEVESYYKSIDKEIISITKFVVNEEIISVHDGYETVVDISALVSIVQQYHSERIISLFDKDFIFLADEKHKEFFEKELRFCFSDFKLFEGYHASGNSDESISKILKKHKKITDLTPDELECFFKSFIADS